MLYNYSYNNALWQTLFVSRIAYCVSSKEKELEIKEDGKTIAINIFFSLSCHTTKVNTNINSHHVYLLPIA